MAPQVVHGPESPDPAGFLPGAIGMVKGFLTLGSFQQIQRIKAEFIVSCGSGVAGVNNFLSRDYGAKGIVILKPGLLGYRRFHLVILPQHEMRKGRDPRASLVYIKAAPNLITQEYQTRQSQALLS